MTNDEGRTSKKVLSPGNGSGSALPGHHHLRSEVVVEGPKGEKLYDNQLTRVPSYMAVAAAAVASRESCLEDITARIELQSSDSLPVGQPTTTTDSMFRSDAGLFDMA